MNEVRRRWPKRLAFITIATLILGVIMLFFVIISSPEYVLSNTLQQISTKPGTYTVTTGGGDNLVVHYDGVYHALDGTYDGVNMQAVLDGKTLYVKTPAPDLFVEKFILPTATTELRSLFTIAAPTLKDRWIAVPIDILLSDDFVGSDCFSGAQSYFATNPGALTQVLQVYNTNKFVRTVQSATTTDTKTYSVGIDKAAYNQFLDTLMQANFYTAIKTHCASFVEQATRDKTAAATIVVTVAARDNSLQSLVANGLTPTQVSVQADYATKPTVTLPTDVMSYDEIVRGATQSLLQSLLHGK